MKKLLTVIICFIVIYNIYPDFKNWVNGLAGKASNPKSASFSNDSGRDKYGLLASAYDKNGWAKVNGKWVSNPRAGATVKYAQSPVIATTSNAIRVTANNTTSNSNSYRNFNSIEETYPILERVARELQYSDIPAMQNSFRRWPALRQGNFYEYDGKRYYSQQALFDYKIQLARSWGSRNDQNGDGKINCQDYAELFYKHAKSEGYNVRYVSNSGLNHAFNSVNIIGTWVSIEPQAAEGGLTKRPYLSNSFSNYNSAYDRIIK